MPAGIPKALVISILEFVIQIELRSLEGRCFKARNLYGFINSVLFNSYNFVVRKAGIIGISLIALKNKVKVLSHSQILQLQNISNGPEKMAEYLQAWFYD